MKKKEILQWIDKLLSKKALNDVDTGYLMAIREAKDRVQQLPEDDWIRFSERMPSDEDFGSIGAIEVASYNDFVFATKVNVVTGVVSEYPYWRKIVLPTKKRPTKEEILEKLGLSEEELKDIIK